jgi:hypothetical protein
MRPRLLSAFAGPAAIVALALVSCSCTVSVSAGSFDPQRASYDNAWNAGWTKVVQDSPPLAATSTSPGVCNVGGTKQGCYDTDRVLISDYQALGRTLTNAPVPVGFAKADATVHGAIDIAIKGLEERDAAIADPSRTGTFTQSNLDLRRSDSLFQQGIKQYTGSQAPVNPFR